MKKILIILTWVFCINTVHAISIEQFNKEEAIYKQQLHQAVIDAGYDPYSNKPLNEQYKEKRLQEETVNKRKELQKQYEQEYQRIMWYEEHKELLIFSLVATGVFLLILITSIYSKKH